MRNFPQAFHRTPLPRQTKYLDASYEPGNSGDVIHDFSPGPGHGPGIAPNFSGATFFRIL